MRSSSRNIARILLYVSCSLWFTVAAARPEAWVIDSGWYYSPTSQWTDLQQFVELAYDPQEEYEVVAVEQGLLDFHPIDEVDIPILWDGQIWARMQVVNRLPVPAAWTFLLHVDQGELYLQQADGSRRRHLFGSNRSRSDWDALRHAPVFPSPYIVQVELPPGARREVLIRLSNRSLHRWIELKAMSTPNFLRESVSMFNDNFWAQGLFHGMCWMMILFSLGTFVVRRRLTYLYLSLYILSVSIFLFFQMELDKAFWIAEYPRLSRVLSNAALNGVVIFYALMIIEFLHRSGWRPDIRRLIRYYFYAALIGGAITTGLLATAPLDWYNVTTNTWLLFPLPLAGLLGLLYICYIYLRSDQMLARIFAVTNLCLFFGSIAYYYWSYSGLVAYREMETYLWPVWIMQGGFVLQMVALVISIGYRDLQVEREQARLAEMDHVKSRFFANISHEFRTPLTLILGPLQEMLQKDTDPWWREQLQLMRRQAQRLLKLINQILDLSRLDSGKASLNLMETDLTALTRALTFSFQSPAERKSIEIDFTSEAESIGCVIDREKIEQAILNLLSNALKYTPGGGRIAVEIYEEAETVYLMISNTGPGISAEHLPHLFERFYQAEVPGFTTDQPSSGIGLALSREWIALHGGSIDVSSRPGKITTFEIRLPKGLKANLSPDSAVRSSRFTIEAEAEPAPAPQAHAPLGAPSQNRPTVLLVEDHPDIRRYIRNSLQEAYELVEATDGRAGLEQATNLVPDLILTDVMMPKMDGFELSRQLKQQEATSHIPIIILTGKSSRDSRLEGLSTQADDFLTKPFDAEELRLRIRNLIRNRALWRERYSAADPLAPGTIDLPSREQAFLQQARDVIEEHLGDESFSVEQLSDAMALNRTQLFRKLKALTGMNPSRFIRSIRLQRARQLLAGKVATAAEIAYMVGFSSPSYFSKCFKEEFGITPGEVA